jgi:hypothetical protein
VLWGIAAAGLVAADASVANAASPVAVHRELIGSRLLSVEIAGKVERDRAAASIRGAGDPDAVYGGRIRLAAFDGRIRIISTYDGATALTKPSNVLAGIWRRRLTVGRGSGVKDGASQQRVEIDVLRVGAAHLSAYGRHCSAGQRFRLAKDGLAPDAEGMGYGLDAVFDALSFRFGHDQSDSNTDGRNGAPTVHEERDVLHAELSLAALRKGSDVGLILIPSRLGYGHIDRHTTSFATAGGAVTAQLDGVTDEISLHWRSALGTTRFGVSQSATWDANGPAGGARSFVMGEKLANGVWRAGLRLGFGTRAAPHAAKPWSAQIYSGRLRFTFTQRDLPALSAGLDVAHFAMHLGSAKRGNDWRLTTSLDFSQLMPNPASGSSRLRLSASVGLGDPIAPAPDTARQLDGTLLLQAAFKF